MPGARGADVTGGAVFSPCRSYRYLLWRTWDPARPRLLVVGLNPSTADATRLDPTSRRCVDFARRWGFGTLLLANVYAFRATRPRLLLTASDPVGKQNDAWLRHLAARADTVLAAWGHWGSGRGPEVGRILGDPLCLGTTKGRQPRHPLYVRGDTRPQPYRTA